MASVKDLKSSIRSVQSTKRITAAMKMVAAAKLKRATDTVEHSRPYTTAMGAMLSNLALGSSAGSSARNPLMIGTGSDSTYLGVVVASDRGLCGGFNGNLARKVIADVHALEKQGKTVKLLLVGRKAVSTLRTAMGDRIVKSFEDLNKPSPEYAHAETVGAEVLGMFNDGAFDVCRVYSNVFVNALTQTPTASQLIPLSVNDSVNDDDQQSGATALYAYEPSEDAILDAVLPQNISVQIFSAMLESFAGEQAARMTAMDNATHNASDLIYSLRIEYNRTRQAQITNELIEIISGAEAL